MKQIQPFQKHWLQITSILSDALNSQTVSAILSILIHCSAVNLQPCFYTGPFE